MRKVSGWLTLIALVFCCFGTGRAQGKSDEMIANLELAMKAMEPEWRCVREYLPQGEPGPPESPRGTKYYFRCQHKGMTLFINIFYGETKRDAEKVLDLSQELLQVNESKPLEGIGEQGYQLPEERFAWITFRKASVFVQIDADIRSFDFRDVLRDSPLRAGPTHDRSKAQSIRANDLIDAAKLFGRLVADHIPAT
jgi:hypothetical protein